METTPKSWKLITMEEGDDSGLNLELTLVSDKNGNFFLKKEEKLFPIEYEQAKTLAQADTNFLHDPEHERPLDLEHIAYEMRENPKYSNLVLKRLQKYESQDSDIKKLSKLLKGIMLKSINPEEKQLRATLQNLRKKRNQILIKLKAFRKKRTYLTQGEEIQEYNLSQDLRNVQIERMRIYKTLEKFGSHKLSLSPIPTVKINEEKVSSELTSLYKNVKDCDYKEYEKLWNDKDNYGPVVSTLTFLGCLKEKIPMQALKRTWIDLKKKIRSSKLLPFFRQYKLLVDDSYQYCIGSYNFLVNFYEKGICNCECGSFLAFMISKINGGKKPIFAIAVTGHMLILESRPGEQLNNWTQFETTVTGGDDTKLTQKNYETIHFAIFTEQIMALYILIYSARTALNNSIFEKMLGINFETMSLEEILIKADRTAVKTPLESNTFDLLLYSKSKNKGISAAYANNRRKYINQDMYDVANGVQFTAEDLKRRADEHRQQLLEINAAAVQRTE